MGLSTKNCTTVVSDCTHLYTTVVSDCTHLYTVVTALVRRHNTVLPIVNFMTSGGQTESCQMNVRVLTVDRTGVDR